jgi:hypothetical protein
MNAFDHSAARSRKLDRWPVWLVSAVAAIVAAKLGWDFGMQLSGVLLAVIAAVNFSVLCALLVGAAAEKLWDLLRRR